MLYFLKIWVLYIYIYIYKKKKKRSPANVRVSATFSLRRCAQEWRSTSTTHHAGNGGYRTRRVSSRFCATYARSRTRATATSPRSRRKPSGRSAPSSPRCTSRATTTRVRKTSSAAARRERARRFKAGVERRFYGRGKKQRERGERERESEPRKSEIWLGIKFPGWVGERTYNDNALGPGFFPVGFDDLFYMRRSLLAAESLSIGLCSLDMGDRSTDDGR